ncbi:hypothetical protein [Hymenobacter sp. UYP22]|uniref:hypothetical protein n=1 Tax=Hymenobacter sp. UYP22 TaxID=3156348 RepID=UPI0033946EE3
MLTLLLGVVSSSIYAQQSTSRTYVVSPVVGPTIDRQEKITFGLFPYYSADNFTEARFEQSQSSDSTVTLITQFRDGRSVLRPFTKAELAAIRETIEVRVRELGLAAVSGTTAASTGAVAAQGPAEIVGQSYSVELVSGTSFVGILVESRPTELVFQTKDLGQITIQRATIRQFSQLSASQVQRGYDPVGNGTRLFFGPTARNLRKGEGYVQNIDIILLGANYGITDNFSVGVLFPLIPGLGANFLAVTPKVSIPVAEKFNVGAGVLYARAFGFGTDGGGAGIGYGVATYGTADNNATLGLGYGFAGESSETTPIVMLGGSTRISRRFSLLNETYFYDGGFAGLIGTRVAASRISGSLGFIYGTEIGSIYPAYAEVAYRFGRIK